MIKRLIYLAVAVLDVAFVFMGYYDWKMAGVLFASFIVLYIFIKRFLF